MVGNFKAWIYENGEFTLVDWDETVAELVYRWEDDLSEDATLIITDGKGIVETIRAEIPFEETDGIGGGAFADESEYYRYINA